MRDGKRLLGFMIMAFFGSSSVGFAEDEPFTGPIEVTKLEFIKMTTLVFHGDAAKAVYESLDVPEWEVLPCAPGVFLKVGKNISCDKTTSGNAPRYQCAAIMESTGNLSASHIHCPSIQE